MSFSKILKEKNVTMYELAKAAGLAQSTVQDVCKGNRKDILLSTAVKISNVLEITAEEVYKLSAGQENTDES